MQGRYKRERCMVDDLLCDTIEGVSLQNDTVLLAYDYLY